MSPVNARASRSAMGKTVVTTAVAVHVANVCLRTVAPTAFVPVCRFVPAKSAATMVAVASVVLVTPTRFVMAQVNVSVFLIV